MQSTCFLIIIFIITRLGGQLQGIIGSHVILNRVLVPVVAVDGIIAARGLQAVTVNSIGMHLIIPRIIVNPVIAAGPQPVRREIPRIQLGLAAIKRQVISINVSTSYIDFAVC